MTSNQSFLLFRFSSFRTAYKNLFFDSVDPNSPFLIVFSIFYYFPSYQIDRGSYGLLRKFLFKGTEHPHVKAYLNFMIDVAVMFGANRTRAVSELHDALQFEIELAKVRSMYLKRTLSIFPIFILICRIKFSYHEQIQAVSQYNPLTISKLQTTYPYLNWFDYIKWNLNNDSIKIDENEVVIVWDRNYLHHLNVILQLTPKRTIANYFAWRLVFFASSLMDDILHQRYQKFIATVTGRLKALPRITECVKRTMSL